MNDRRTRPAPEVDSLPPIEADDDAGVLGPEAAVA